MTLLRRLYDLVRRNPVRVRAAVVAALSLIGYVVPEWAGLDTDPVVVGVIMGVLALVCGWDAARLVDLKPTRRETRDQSPAMDAGYEGRHR